MTATGTRAGAGIRDEVEADRNRMQDERNPHGRGDEGFRSPTGSERATMGTHPGG